MGTTFDDRIAEDMHASVAGLQLPPGLLSAARRRHERRRLAVRVTTGVTVAAAVTGALATATTGGPANSSEPRAITNSPSSAATVAAPKLETVAYVRQRIAEAPDPRHAIIRTSTHRDGQVIDNWTDSDTGYNTDYITENGRVISASRYPITRAGRTLDIDYVTRTWAAGHQPAMRINPDATDKTGAPRVDTVAGIKAAVQRSDVSVLGDGTVDGRAATHIRFVYRSKDDPGASAVEGDAWFDSQTFAPLRASTTYVSPGSASTTISTSFLTRTAANVARTRLTVPDGFRQVAPASK
jgi:hypothetical protein